MLLLFNNLAPLINFVLGKFSSSSINATGCDDSHGVQPSFGGSALILQFQILGVCIHTQRSQLKYTGCLIFNFYAIFAQLVHQMN
jgi:hypothetical protein